jgi:hypothetical protein
MTMPNFTLIVYRGGSKSGIVVAPASAGDPESRRLEAGATSDCAKSTLCVE